MYSEEITIIVVELLVALIKRFFPDVIHAHVAQGAGRVAFLWKKVFGTPYILTEHAPVEMMGFKSKRNIFISKCVYKNSWHNVCVSIDLAKKLRSFFPKERFDVIYNGVVSPKALIAQNKYEIDIHHKINCGIVAAFYDKEIKGFQFLLPAIKQVSERGIDICLHICGGGKYLSFYENMAKELGISERCFFYGQLDKKKVYSIVSQMNFMISASLYESAGVSAEEAMLLGKPMLVTRSGGVNSLVPTNVSVVVDKGSTKCLVDGFEKMIQNYTSYDSEFIMNYAYENFDIEVISKKYMDLYNNLMLKRK